MKTIQILTVIALFIFSFDIQAQKNNNACVVGNGTATNIQYYVNGRKVPSLNGGIVKNSTRVEVRFTVPKGSTPTKFSLVSYIMPDSDYSAADAQYFILHDKDSRIFRPGKHRLMIVTPNNFFEVDFVKGCVLDPPGPQGSGNFYEDQHRLINQVRGGKRCGTPDCPCDRNDKITICHIPPGNDGNAHAITISINAWQWPAHEKHGDYLGSCRQDTTVPCDTCGSTGGLPVKLIKFEAQKIQPNEVELRWATASEINNDYIAIEKSTDISTWEEVCRVAGAPGGSSQTTREYSCVDKRANSGGQNLVYYRPKQVDFNGTYEYFNIIKLRLENADYASSVDQVYPNPANDRIHIKYNSSENGIFNIRLMGLDGRTLLQNEFVAKQGQQVVDLNLPEEKLSTGFYILEVKSDDQVFRQKVYKQ